MPDYREPHVIDAGPIRHDRCPMCIAFDNLLEFTFANGARAVVHPGCQRMAIYEMQKEAGN